MRNIGRFSKRVLLTGAGWSRNWGGRIASEIWDVVMGHSLVTNNQRLRSLLLNEPSFENALSKTFEGPFTETDRSALTGAIFDTFRDMDQEISRSDQDPWVNIYQVQEFLFRFWGTHSCAVDAGYIFTLNQDLFFERHLYNEHVYGADPPALPGIRGRPNHRWFTTQIGPYSEEFIRYPLEDATARRLHRQTNIVKLHGSFNWRNDVGEDIMVMGAAKPSKIRSFSILNWYFDLFAEALKAGDIRLMTVGYGFGDEHINAVIAEAMDDFGLKIWIWDVGSDLADRVRAAPHGQTIWENLISKTTRRMIEVFPSNQSRTDEYKRIRRDFFE